ncbi:ribose 5-phosphate isomerase B [Halalkalibacter wakoensis JCM 9140]|uniref:Ribose 5-phosphate isomerase B n=1 Tax=Halalkalibacter wakoensis JCM 9140 TaxID=1236970 RepID=W4Q8L4_9BACI|nr:ribose 5-phosphate isomerase B [Halalkalibacter wakoensis]GAE27739.1 ribose 5-phosphate isomerase B [Halalkalibacter wakoensis JCM 9140]
MKIAIGSDHAGFSLKETVMKALELMGHEVTDYGCYDDNPVDFPDIAKGVCKAILKKDAERGIMVCGTGVGAAIASNKIPGIRASVCHDVYSAHQCVEHDNVNVMCIGAQIVGNKLAIDLLETYLQATFSTEVHFRRRVQKLELMEVEFHEYQKKQKG